MKKSVPNKNSVLHFNLQVCMLYYYSILNFKIKFKKMCTPYFFCNSTNIAFRNNLMKEVFPYFFHECVL